MIENTIFFSVNINKPEISLKFSEHRLNNETKRKKEKMFEQKSLQTRNFYYDFLNVGTS